MPNFQARRLADETRAASFSGRSTRASEPHPGAPAGPLRLAFSRGHRRGHPCPSTVDPNPRRVRHRRRGPRRRQRHVRPRRHLSGRARLQARRVSSDASPIRRRTRLVGRLGDEKTRSRRERPPGRHLLPRAKLRVFTPARGWESGRNGVLPPPLVAAGDAPEADEGTNDAATGTRNRDPAVREDEDDPPESYTVSGAGIRRVNGEYVRDGTFQGAHLYKKGRLRLVRFRMTSHPGQADVWFVADSRRLTSDSGDFTERDAARVCRRRRDGTWRGTEKSRRRSSRRTQGACARGGCGRRCALRRTRARASDVVGAAFPG